MEQEPLIDLMSSLYMTLAQYTSYKYIKLLEEHLLKFGKVDYGDDEEFKSHGLEFLKVAKQTIHDMKARGDIRSTSVGKRLINHIRKGLND